ncbi:transmembrane protein 119, partial [Phaethornis superciliosus]
VVLVVPAGSAAPRHPVVLAEEGSSGDGEEVSALPPLPRVTPGTGPTLGTPVSNSSAAGGVLDGLVDFFKEYMLLVVVVGSLAFVLLFIICAALVVRQKHKASAYYPSSFPKKKYVDQRDKVGGPRAFNEVPEKNPDPGTEEHLDCNRQLQADILTAAQNLKSPPKTQGEQNPPPEEAEEEGNKKSGGKQPAEPPPQSPGAEEAVGTTGAGNEGTPSTAQEGPPGPPSI